MPKRKAPTRNSKIAYIKRIIGYQLWKLNEDELNEHYEQAKETQKSMVKAKKALNEAPTSLQ